VILDLFRLDGKVAIVTGAGRGIGAASALALAECGADVVIASRNAERPRSRGPNSGQDRSTCGQRGGRSLRP